MSRLFAAILLLPVMVCCETLAQGPVAPLWPTEVIGESTGGFTFSVRLLGDAKVRFGNLGTIESLLDPGDATSEMSRQYHDGYVLRDSRTASDGTDLPDDGFTNAWSMLFDSQVLSDQSGIAFHHYSTISDGATVDADSGSEPGVDMELSRRFGGFGKRMADNRRSGSWGAFAGGGLTEVNAKTSASITATLRSTTDVYTLDGATPPSAVYTAPSSETVTVIGPDGSETSVTLNTTVLLGNRPSSRAVIDDVGAAEIDGFWQVRGAYLSLRAGLWGRWHLSRQLSLRASVGASFSLLGIDMRYDELLAREGLREQIRAQDQTKTTNFDTFGAFGSLDLEFWLTRRTGFFASVTYEDVSQDIVLELGGRTATVEMGSGTGFRVGFTTLF